MVRCEPGAGEGGAGSGSGRRGIRGVLLRTTSGSSACGQSGCQALGLWIAGLGVGGGGGGWGLFVSECREREAVCVYVCVGGSGGEDGGG